MIRSILRFFAAAGLVTAVLLGVAGSPASGARPEHVSKLSTRVNLEYSFERSRMIGRANSWERCEGGRRVRLFRRAEGEDPIVDVFRTDSKGRFHFRAEIAPDGERYYARIPESRIKSPNRLTVCRDGRSRDVTAAGEA